MAAAVARAIEERRHLVVQAGTGTGKSLAYLVPALTLGVRAVVSTATKTLQDQLAQRDLPRLAEALGHFEFAVLKGRSNYVCAQRVKELAGAGEQLSMDEAGKGPVAKEVWRLVEWAGRRGPAGRQKGRSERQAVTGDRAELSWEPSDLAWAQVTTGWRECPGANDCPSGPDCFAELARDRASRADVVVVNTHLYATSLALPEAAELLPPHDVVVFDEAHELEDIVSAALGFDISEARLGWLAKMARPLGLTGTVVDDVADAGARLAALLRAYRDKALPRPLGEDLAYGFNLARERVGRLAEEVRKLSSARQPCGSAEDDAKSARLRVQKAASHLLSDLSALLDLPCGQLAWVEGPEAAPVARVAPIDVGTSLRDRLWHKEGAPTAVLTSATIPPHIAERVGLPAGGYDVLDVGSPFEYSEQALLYCPVHLPDPRAEGFEQAMHEELVALVEAAEGRTLALFTSWRAMRAAAEVVRGRVGWKVLTQSDLPKPKLVAEFSTDEHSCLFATMGFWQGVDVPGPALSLVTIDRLPFPRPDEPLLAARREALGRRAFELIDVPRAATLLAQGVGRLVRSRLDRGVVAVFDRRLGKASYRWELVNALPPMKRTRSREEVVAFLAALRSG
jgi:ATP-dependent DNA helicase DinG